MNILNRLPDVYAIMQKACQEYLSLVVKNGWQQAFYSTVVQNMNGKYSNVYKQTYNDMRNMGVNNYSVADMDITTIYAFVCYSRIVNASQATKEALLKVKNDKNTLQSHVKLNVQAEDLYLQAIMALVNLEEFVKAVDNNEKQYIDDSTRSNYRRVYYAQITNLKREIDNERISITQKRKEIEESIQYIIDNNNSRAAWVDILSKYTAPRTKRIDTYALGDFAVSASDAGIPYAHIYASDYFYNNQNYPEYFQRLVLAINTAGQMSPREMKNTLCRVNFILENGMLSRENENVKEFVDAANRHGYSFVENGNKLTLVE